MVLKDFLRLTASIVVAETAGAVGTTIRWEESSTWFATQIQSPLTPSIWFLHRLWFVLYFMIGLSAWFVWRQGQERADVRHALTVWCIQILLNSLWMIVFFGLFLPGYGLVMIAVLWLVILWNIIAFYRISRVSAYLLLPYLFWIAFASYLNYMVWILNPV